MFKRFDQGKLLDEYDEPVDIIEDATRFYHEHFTMEEDYDEKFEVKTTKEAIDLFETNGYQIEVEETLGFCPVCGSGNITYEGSDIDGFDYWYKCYCDDCDAYFEESYKLEFTGYDNIQKGEE